MKICLIRHGEKEFALGDPGLTKRGIEQAEKAAQYFLDKNIGKIYSSPLKRTMQTAEIISKVIHQEVVIDERLAERMNWGDINDQSFEEFIKEWHKTTDERSYKPKVGKSSIEKGKEVDEVIHNLEDNNRNILLVTHGGSIKDFVLNLTYIVPDFTSRPQMAEINRPVAECSITEIEKDGDQYYLLKFAENNY